jgi:hypothetical protein
MCFKDIEQFPQSHYHVTTTLDYVTEILNNWNERDTPLIMNPEWQRGHVWTREQQISFIEYLLKGGTTGRNIYFNCSSWGDKYNTPIFCLDGLQRISAWQAFENNEIPVFGSYFKDFEDKSSLQRWYFDFYMLKLKNKKELLSVYLNFNAGGTVHDPKELKRIEEMIANTDSTEIL